MSPNIFQFKNDNKVLCVSWRCYLVCAVPALSPGNQNLASKVIRIPLNQNEPAVVKVGTRGITTLEFPYKIEALDGYGFSVNPSPDGADLFQISLNKGTNFLSLKAMREGVEGNLTVVLDGRVFCLFCTAVADPSFVVIFGDSPAKHRFQSARRSREKQGGFSRSIARISG